VGILLLLGILFLVVLVSIAVVVAVRRPGKPAPSGPGPAAGPAKLRQQRQAILNQMAQKKISREEAESRLASLGEPASGRPAAAPAPGGRGCGTAALVVAVVGGFLLLLLVVLLLFFGLFAVRHAAAAQVMPQPVCYEPNAGLR
jgi:hypothetical protein